MVVADTLRASVYFEDDTVSVLFIDADHRLEGVRADYEVWYRKVRSGGAILMHNANGCGVRRNVIEHPGAMSVFANAIIRNELEGARLVGTMGIGVKP